MDNLLQAKVLEFIQKQNRCVTLTELTKYFAVDSNQILPITDHYSTKDKQLERCSADSWKPIIDSKLKS